MYKKLLAAGLALAMVLSTAACTSDSAGETAPETTGTTATKPSTLANAELGKFESQTLVDTEDMLFKITAITEDPIWGYSLKVQIENRTDKDLMFTVEDVSVNGFMCEPYFAATVTAGMKANEEISFSQDTLEESGIETVTDIEFDLRVYNSDNWAEEDLLEEPFRIYPLGKDAATVQIRQSQETDIVLFDNDSCTMIVTGFDPDSIWGYSALVYLVNKTDDTLMFCVGDAAINGFMCEPYFAQTVTAGKQCITRISWSKTVLEESEITEVETISLPVRVYDAEDWNEKDLIDETFTVKP